MFVHVQLSTIQIIMKKINIIFLSLMISIILGGCTNRGKQLTKELGSEQQMADDVMKEVSLALDNQDEDRLKKMFSEKTRKEITNLNQQILDMLNFYKGKMKNYEGHIASSNTRNKGVLVEEQIKGMYRLSTDNENYRVYFKYKPVSKENLDEVGLSSIELITETAYQKAVVSNGSYDWQTGVNGPGVYIKE